ncbi:YciI family protein [Cupriavidus taiwanensis]|uniref:YciI family protein n=1 Tax=Cupriavidus taiwanensis TaxID=164546 RepID=UPI000E15C583|nr:YciI family protein [Cupriavidus taiwanensis]SPC18377.1 YCII-related protein [Cupriavidus taiwanensis]
MFYIIHALDKADAVALRLAHYEAHKTYLAQASIRTLISGPLVSDDGETMIGSFFLVAAESKEDVIAFNANDPFARAGLWQQVSIHAFNKRVDNR